MLIAIRPFSFIATILPVTAGAMIAENFSFSLYIISLLAAIFIHAGVNTTNDYFDFKKGIDTKDSLGSSGLLINNILKPKDIFIISIISYILSIILGLFLIYKVGIGIFWFGLLGIILGYSYTGFPLHLKYKALGIPLVFTLMGPLMVLGSYYVQTKHLSDIVFLLSIPIGISTILILLSNDIRDIEHDKKSKIITLPILLGEKKSIILYLILAISIYFFIFYLIYIGIFNFYAVLSLFSLFIYIHIFKKFLHHSSKKEIAMVDRFSAIAEIILTITILIALVN
ncbi:1,4-dihydroxy-2-naphthoate prenyltransferase [Marinitoga sp. 1154]|nr:1,4-dihydroxy-2-naphthoate prenyltransferase [Marinitoga sp. 1154]